MPEEKNTNFIREAIDEHLAHGRFNNVYTRFPPEPNGYLHIGHATALHTNFSLAQAYNGHTNLRFDDTNPAKEEIEYVEGIMNDIRWLGYQWDKLLYASDYFDQLYNWAIQLIKQGDAYVDDLSQEEMREYRGTLTTPGKNSPYRNRSVEENLTLFERMKNGEFPEGARVLRAKIDMQHPNVLMRDPTMYRIMHMPHHRTADKWCIYPMYDWAHGQSDSIEGITHSLCSLEYVNHRPIYDWFINKLGIYAPQQIEFSRVSLNYTVVSKRKLRQLVEGGHVAGWDDPRMPTLIGMRRRGYPPAAIRQFCDMVGVAKATYNVIVDMGMLEYAIRDELNQTADRIFAVLDPLKLIITNYPTGETEEFEATNNRVNEESGTRHVPFTRELYIEREDFRENPPGKYKRMAPGRIIRLMNAYLVTCDKAIKDENGRIIEVHCHYHPETKGGNAVDGLKPKGTIHWVSAPHALTAEVRLYDRLFTKEEPDNTEDGQHFLDFVNPNSLQIIPNAQIEPSVATAPIGTSYQFMRTGYFTIDPDTTAEKIIFNRTVTLRDTWAKLK